MITENSECLMNFMLSLTVQVAGVVGRAECLSAIFFLSCILTYKQSVAEAKMTGV